MKRFNIFIAALFLSFIWPAYAFAGQDNILNDTLFVGDSFTAKFKGYDLDTAGIEATAGYTAMELADIVSGMPAYEPSRIVVLAGINDIVVSGNPDITGQEQLLRELQGKYNCPIYVQLLFPVTEALISVKPQLNNLKIEEYNRHLIEHCDSNGYFYIDTRSGFIDESGYLKHTDDGLHISDEYQEVYLQNIAGEIREREQKLAISLKEKNISLRGMN